jgi:cell division protein FtsB
MRLFQSIADFFYLSWYLLRSLFMSQEALEREIAEMRQQIAVLKAEAALLERSSGWCIGDI